MADVSLAMDTASTRLSVALVRPGHPPVVHTVDGPRQHAAALLPLIDQGLAELGATADELRTVVLADGPGSFTGLRVGAAVAKALSRAGAVRLFTAPSLLVRAAGLEGAQGRSVLAVSHALRGEVYAGIWRFESGRITTVMTPRAIDAQGVLVLAPVDQAIGEAPEEIGAALRARGLHLVTPGLPSAVTLLELMDRDGGCREIIAPDAWEPEYGRPAEAQAKWERTHGRTLPDSPGRIS